MNKKKLMSKILTAVVAGGVILSTGSLTFAKDTIGGATGSTVKKQQVRMNKQNQTQNMKSALDKLVTAGTITTDQETKVLEYITAQQTAKQAEMEKVKNLTEAERKPYFENNRKEKTDLFSELVTAGIISQDKADSIKAAMPTPKNHN